MKETKLAYIAGLIDADGGFSISKSISSGYVQYDPLIRITSTHLPTIKWVIKTFGGSYKKYVWDNPEHKNYYSWKFTSDLQASRFLYSILPYLWIKRDQAILMMDYYEFGGTQAKEQREYLYLAMRALNSYEPITTNTSRLPLKGKIRAAYFAGVFDGEGSSYIIRVRQSKWSRGGGFYYRAEISLGMSENRLIHELKRSYGGHVRSRPPHRGKLPMYEWSLKSNDTKENFLLQVLPYLITKREQSKLILNFVRMNGNPNPDKRHSMWLLCSELNGNKRESDLMGDHESTPIVI